MEFYVLQKDVRLFCKKTGDGPVLLLIHGIGCDSGFFEDTIKLLSKHFTVISYDRRGYGKSCDIKTRMKNNFTCSLKQQVDDAATIICHLDCGPVTIASSSAGGIIALELAAVHPDLVKSLYLHEPPVLLTENDQRAVPELAEWLLELRETGKSGSENRLLKSFIRALGGVDPLSPATDMEQLQKNIQYLKHFRDFEMQELFEDKLSDKKSHEEKMARYRQLETKVIITVGSDDEQGIFHRTAKQLSESVGYRLLYIPGYHNIAREQPRVYAQVMETVQKIQNEKHKEIIKN